MSRVDTDAMRRYEETRDDLVARLLAIEPFLADEVGARVAAFREHLARTTFVLAVVGEFSSGKSFLLNALLGKFRYEETPGGKQLVGLLATDINPSTATITELRHGESDSATAHFEDGYTERIPLDRLNRFVAVGEDGDGALHDATKDATAAPSRVVVTTDSSFLARGFVVADTPGLASVNPAHRRTTLQFLPSADAVLYLIDTQQPFSEGDAAFLGIVRAHVDSIFIVQTKIDLWQQPQNDGRPAWVHAHERIATLAAIHAPGTYVYALSARDYVEGVLDGNTARIDESRFPAFLSALDASLINRTGRARLRRTLAAVAAAVNGEREQIERDLVKLALDESTLQAARVQALPTLERIDERARAEHDTIVAESGAARHRLDEGTLALAQDVEHALAQAFDTADVARLRDRARLHIIVDRVVAQVIEGFARAASANVVTEIETALTRIRAFAPIRFSTGDAASDAFGGTAGTSLWSGEPSAAISATIVLDAIGGLAIGIVHDIATRFSARPPGGYMKRELIADLRTDVFPRLRDDVLAFGNGVATRFQRIYDALGEQTLQAAHEQREAELGSIDRALRAHAAGTARAQSTSLRERSETLREELDRASAVVQRFMERDEEIAPADPGSETVRAAHVDASFDRAAYDLGLQPQRWRVAVLGALRRGKTSLINAFAGRAILTDDAAGSARFPVHVRYGEREQAFVLDARGAWRELPVTDAAAAAADAPVLLLVPWTLPRELVLVHAPAFDSGDPAAEDVNAVVANHASEVLCLFSRQLSDRELSLYERVAEFGKPMLFAHTIADNEAPNERRHVLRLAETYLRERHIPSERIFTLSAHEYADAKRSGRAPAAWNEMEALRATLEGHAEAHMLRLDRLARTKPSPAAAAASAAELSLARPRSNLFTRIFGKGR